MKDPELSTLDLKVTETTLDIKAKSTTSEEEYDLHIDFYKDIDTSSVRQTITGSHIFFVLVKKDLDEEFWPRLTKEKVKYRNIRTDFDRWVDEDEQDEKADEPIDGMDDLQSFSQNNLDFSELAKQFGGAGAAGFGKDGPSQFGDFNENEFSSSGDEDGDENTEEHDHTHEHGESHEHHDHEHGHSHTH
jgi:hypothetical protein